MVASTIVALWVGSLGIVFAIDVPALLPFGILPVILARTFIQTGLFIIAHDAIHGSVLPGDRHVNYWIGQFALALYALLPYQKLAHHHWQHHLQPGQVGDPDFHDGVRDSFGAWYLKFMQEYLDFRQKIVLFFGMKAIFFTLFLGFHVPIANLFLFWVLPIVLSSVQLFLFGTYLPHRSSGRPTPTSQHQNSHNAVSSNLPLVWSFLTCYHFGYHWEHHEYPSLPWYRLPSVRQYQPRFGKAEATPTTISRSGYLTNIIQSEFDEFSNPRSVAVDRSNGNVYVLDANGIGSYNSSGVLLKSFTGSFGSSTGLAIDSSSNLYVADPGQNQIFKFDSNGQSLASIGNGNGYFSGKLGVAVDNTGQIYVANSGSSQIEKFAANGQFLASIGGLGGSGNGYFSGNLGVAVDNTGNIYVADEGDSQIEKFDTNGQFLASIGNGVGDGDGQFRNLTGVAVDSNGKIYTTDNIGNHRVQEFAADGTFLSSFGNGYGSGQTGLNNPQGLAANNGIIYTVPISPIYAYTNFRSDDCI